MAMKDRRKQKCQLKEDQGELENDVSHLGLRRSPGRQPPHPMKACASGNVTTEMLPRPLSMASHQVRSCYI